MSVIYFYAEDEKHFKEDGIEQIKKNIQLQKLRFVLKKMRLIS